MLAEFIDENANTYETVAQEIWELAEVGYMENESSEMLQGLLRSAGFDVEAGVAGIPTAFVASYGAGGGSFIYTSKKNVIPGIVPFVDPTDSPKVIQASKSAGNGTVILELITDP